MVDVVFGLNIIPACLSNTSFKKMIADISIEGVNKSLVVKKEKVNLDFALVSEFKCKGLKP